MASAPSDRRGSEVTAGDALTPCSSSTTSPCASAASSALDDVEPGRHRGRDLRAHRSQRRRQDDGLQRRHRRLPADRGRGPLRRASRWSGMQAPPDHQARHRPHVPEHPALPQHDRARERDGRRRRPPPHQRARRRPAACPGTAREEREGRDAGHRAARLRRHRPSGRRRPAKNLPYGDQRRLEIARALATDRSCCCSTSRPPASTRPRRRRCSDLIRKIRDTGYTDPADRARHGPGDGHLRPDRRARLRQKIAEGLPAEVQTDPTRHRGLSGGAAPMLLEVDGRRTSTTARSRRSRASRSTVDEGEIVTLIGANGAGKTTTLKTISGLRPRPSGRITFDGRDITELPGHERVELGHLPGARGPGHLPGHDRAGEPRDGRLRPDRAPQASVDDDLERVFDALPPPGRAAQADGRHAVRRRAADARHRPGADGPTPSCCCSTSRRWAWRRMLVAQIFSIITEINRQGTTVLLVEQNAAQALPRAHRAYVLETGRVVRSAAPAPCSTTSRCGPPTWATPPGGSRRSGGTDRPGPGRRAGRRRAHLRRKEVLPVASDLEHRDAYPTDLVRQMAELGLFGAVIPEEYGGLGLDVLTYARLIEELAVGLDVAHRRAEQPHDGGHPGPPPRHRRAEAAAAPEAGNRRDSRAAFRCRSPTPAATPGPALQGHPRR